MYLGSAALGKDCYNTVPGRPAPGRVFNRVGLCGFGESEGLSGGSGVAGERGKICLTLSRITSFLGYVLDSGAQKTCLPPGKIERLTHWGGGGVAGLQNNIPLLLR